MITGKIVGAETVNAMLMGATPRIREEMVKVVKASGVELMLRVKDKYLHGPKPQHLGVKTGNLTRSIAMKGPEVTSQGDVTGIVGTNVSYGRFWELGFHGDISVRAHVRKVKARSTFARVAKPGTKRGWGREKTSEGIGYVRAHTRENVNIAPRPFLVPALRDTRAAMRANIMKGLAQALTNAASSAIKEAT